MRPQQRGGQSKKYQVREPPTFVNFYKKLESNQQTHRQAQNRMNFNNSAPQNKYASSNVSGLAKYQRTAEPAQSKVFDSKVTVAKSSKINPQKSYAPSSQFRVYLNSTKNVFYEQRQEAKILRNIYTVKPVLNYLAALLFLSWAILFFINPIQGSCPQNADCGVFIHCNRGFTLKNNDCVVSEQTKDHAASICLSTVENLKYMYGSQDCQDGEQFKPIPLKTMSEVLHEYQVDNKAASQQIYHWFRDQQNQILHKFNFRNTEVTPNEKKYTVFCQFQRIAQSKWFIPSFIFGVTSLIAISIALRIFRQKRRATKIYQSLKDKVKGEGDIVIKRDELQKNYGRIYAVLWEEIDKARVQDKCIAFYEDEHLHWKLI